MTGAAVSRPSVPIANDATVTIGNLTRTGATAIGNVIKAIIDGPLGFEADIVEDLSDGSVIAAGMDKCNGSADVHTDLWMPNRQGIRDSYAEADRSVGRNEQFPGNQMMNVRSYMPARVSAVDDPKDPEAAAVFDKDGNCKGECGADDAGWNSTRIRQVNRMLQPLRQWPAPVRSSSCWRRMPGTGNLTRCPPA